MSHPIPLPASADAPTAVLDGHAAHALPLGTELRFFDGTPRPPERHRRKLSAWQTSNGTGRLVEKVAAQPMGDRIFPAHFTLQIGCYGSNGTIILVVRRVYSVNTELRFEILARPEPGMVRVLQRWNGRDELKHLAVDMAAAQAWIASNGGSYLVTEVVGDDEDAPALGRAA